MRRRMASLMVLAAMLAGCGKVAEDSPTGPQQLPDVALTAAPGVAFTYRYAFRLPFDRVAAAQEAHAQACERLGIARCRITGMQYRVLGEKRTEGMLSFRLAPDIARRFGKAAEGEVRTAGGALVDAEITGTDGKAGDRIDLQERRAGRVAQAFLPGAAARAVATSRRIARRSRG